MIIIDASVAIKWINYGEEDRESALLLYEKHIQKEDSISIPAFLFLEVANVLVTKPHYSEESIENGLNLLFTSNFLIYQETNDDISEAAILAKKYKTSVYDMLYAVIAKKNKCLLITADEKFSRKVNFPFVKTIKEYPF